MKSPKVYVRDSGLLCALLGIRSWRDFEGHPGLGAAWEGFVLEEIVRRVGERDLYFWSTHGGAELDAILVRGSTRIGFEMKWGDAPTLTKSMHVALEDLALKALFVVYPGPTRYRLHPKVEVVPITQLDRVLP